MTRRERVQLHPGVDTPRLQVLFICRGRRQRGRSVVGVGGRFAGAAADLGVLVLLFFTVAPGKTNVLYVRLCGSAFLMLGNGPLDQRGGHPERFLHGPRHGVGKHALPAFEEIRPRTRDAEVNRTDQIGVFH